MIQIFISNHAYSCSPEASIFFLVNQQKCSSLTLHTGFTLILFYFPVKLCPHMFLSVLNSFCIIVGERICQWVHERCKEGSIWKNLLLIKVHLGELLFWTFLKALRPFSKGQWLNKRPYFFFSCLPSSSPWLNVACLSLKAPTKTFLIS